MTEILRFWRDLPQSEKQSLMTERNIKSITYFDIKGIYEGNGK